MPDWKDPAEILRDSLFLAKLVHICLGCASWEVFSHLHYEWDVYRGKKRYRWTIWVYTSCRLSMLTAYIFDTIGINGGTERHCTAIYVAALSSGYLSMALASFLLVLRITAFWKKWTAVVVMSYLVWLSSIALNIHDVTLLRANYNLDFHACLPYKTHAFLPNSIGILASDTVLLVLMLAGVLSARRDSMEDGITGVLYRQGLIWMVVAIVVEVPVVVFAVLDLNDPLVSMFQPLELLCLGICAGRMYRDLMNYAHKSDNRIRLRSIRL